MAHILFVYKQLPAPLVGHAGGVSLFGLMQGLYRRGHRLTLIARILEEERAQLAEVQAICDRVFTLPHHRVLPGPRPLALMRSYWMLRRTTARVLKDLRPDFIHVETTQTAAILYGLRLPPASFRTQDVNWFLQQQQMAGSHGWARLKAQAKQAFFKWFEPQVWRSYDVLLAISEGDRQLLAPHCHSHQLLLLPLSPAMQPAPGIAPAVSSGPNLVFVGAMSRDHNINGVL
ncbi:MAG: glycosyltransferase, partial [Anaerolineae bacterium]|nr:glycosyltransferase [Anaerolineae bacterium]